MMLTDGGRQGLDLYVCILAGGGRKGLDAVTKALLPTLRALRTNVSRAERIGAAARSFVEEYLTHDAVIRYTRVLLSAYAAASVRHLTGVSLLRVRTHSPTHIHAPQVRCCKR